MKFFYALTLLMLLASMASASDAAACICTADYSPVCGTNGRTYSNICRLSCAKATLKRRGPC